MVRKKTNKHKTDKSKIKKKNSFDKKPMKIELTEFLKEIAIDEESVLANLAFDPIIIGRQLLENHFSTADFKGSDSNRLLLGMMLEIIEEGITLNLPNLVEHLVSTKRGKSTLLDLVGGQERLQELFMSPFSHPGVKMLDDIEPLIERIRDRNIRAEAHRIMIQYSERVMYGQKDAFEILGSCIQNLRSLFLQGSAGYIQTMSSHVAEMEELIEVNRGRSRGYLGYDTSFPVLSERLGGFQKEFYLITGGVGMGKSTFATQLAWELATLNPELTVIFFSLDLNRIDVTSKMVAQAAEVPIEYVRNPQIIRDEFEEKRLQGLKMVGDMHKRLLLVDESSGRLFIDDVKKYVKRIRLERGGEVAVVIDPIFKIRLRAQNQMNFNERSNLLASELKSMSAVEGVTVIATAGLPKAVSSRRPVKDDLEDIMGLLYDPYAVFFLYSDYLNNFDTPFLEWEWGKEDSFMIPIAEAMIAKNKMGGINTRTFFRFFEAYSKFKECAPQEIENYSAMIENMEKFKEKQNVKVNNRNHSRSEEF